jgi:hypothetical protein
MSNRKSIISFKKEEKEENNIIKLKKNQIIDNIIFLLENGVNND